MSRGQCLGTALVHALVLSFSLALGDAGEAQISARDTVEARTLLPLTSISPLQFSPDESHFAVVLEHGDLGTNETVVEIFGGTTDTLSASQSSRIVATFRAVLTGPNPLRDQPLQWIDRGRSIALLWPDSTGVNQVWSVNLDTAVTRQISHSTTNILSFDLNDAGTLLFAAEPAPGNASTLMLREGFVVGSQLVDTMMSGDLAGEAPWGSPRFILQRGGEIVAEIPLPARRTLLKPDIAISPDGKWAIVTMPPAHFPSEWSRYPPAPDLEGLSAAPTSGQPTAISQFWLLDLARGTSRPLIDVPRRRQGRALWSPDSKYAIAGPIFAPAGNMGNGEATYHTMLNVHSGRIDLLRSRPRRGRGLAPIGWRGNSTVVIGDERGSQEYSRRETGWFQSTPWRESRARGRSSVRISIDQELNSSPAIVARDMEGRSEVLLQLSQSPQGRAPAPVRLVDWTDVAGRRWTGTLVLPASGASSHRSPPPLVVQISGHAIDPNQYTWLGAALTTAFAAQPLATNGIAVLTLSMPDGGFPEGVLGSSDEAVIIQAGVESGIRALQTIGVIDGEKIGLLGFSRTGWYVLHILAKSDLNYVAANVADNSDGGYMQYIFASREFSAGIESEIGGSPYGGGLAAWLENSPVFLSDRIRAPLRLERDQGYAGVGPRSLLYSWEIFVRLRARGQPVELYAVPNLDQGAHNLEQPRQRLASREGTTDWFSFWLLNYEDPRERKVPQYLRWRRLREQRDAVLFQPRPPLLDWSNAPR